MRREAEKDPEQIETTMICGEIYVCRYLVFGLACTCPSQTRFATIGSAMERELVLAHSLCWKKG